MLRIAIRSHIILLRFFLHVEDIPHRKFVFFFEKKFGIRDQLQFHGHDIRGDREIEAFHRFNGPTEVEGSVVVA